MILVDKNGLWEIKIKLLDELADVIDSKMNAEARNPERRAPQQHVNIPVAIIKEVATTGYELATQSPVQGAIRAGEEWQNEFVAAAVTPDSNEATAHGIKAVGAAIKFTVNSIRIADSLLGKKSAASASVAPSQIMPPSGKPPAAPAGTPTEPKSAPPALPPGKTAPVAKSPGPTVDPLTGHEVGEFVVDPKGNTVIQPKGGTTTGSKDGVFTESQYPNGSPYQQQHGPHKKVPDPHGHGFLEGSQKNQRGPSLDPQGNVVPEDSKPAHWPINK